MKKRFLSIVLAVLMLLSVLPVTAMAADGTTDTGAEGAQTAVGAVSADKAIHVNKSVVTDAETGKTSLELEAFATNSVSTHTSYEPLDIVLVLDVSGSMDDNKITSYKYTETKKDKWSCDDIYNSSVYYYYKDSEGYYRRVSWDDEGGIIRPYRCWITAGGTRIGEKVSGWYDTSYRGTLYTRTNDGTKTRMAAMQAAVNAFIDNVAAQKDSEGKPIDNHISIVKFAGKKSTEVGNETYKDGKYTYNYSQVVKGLTKASTGSGELKAAVNGLKAAGATQADFGMQLAKSVLPDNNATRKSVVILFTDGEPTSGSSFESSVASNAIKAAKALKTGGTTVFTVGIFEGAKPNASVTASSTSDMNKYMHAVSSNYPSATYEDEGYLITNWTWTFGMREKDSNYYLAAQNAAELEDIFEAISKEVNTLAVKVDETSVLSDTLSGAFDFNAPENAEYSGITVAKYPVTGMENGVYTWGAAQELTIGEGEGKVQVEVAGKKLNVTGFDYGKNAVTTKTEGETTTYSGYKLVVTIPIKPDTEYHGWADGAHYYDTNSTANGSKAGLEYGETGSRQKLELNDSPNAPVTGYTVSYKHQGEKPSTANDFKDERYYIAGQEATVKAAPTSPVTEGDFTYTFVGWTSSEIENGKISITDHNVTVTGNWTKTASTTTVGVTKNWNFVSDGKTHTAVVKLYADGVVVDGYTFNRVYIEGNSLTLSEKATRYFKDLPIKNDLGEKIVYTAKEISIDGIPVPVAEEGENTVYVTAESASAAEGGYATKVWKITTDGLVITNVLEDATKHTVSYEFKGETPEGATAPVSKSYFVGQKYALESVTGVDDWTFEGWYDSYDETNGFGSKVTGEQTMGSSDVTYYGKWTFTKDKPEITEAGYTVKYYRQNADGENYTLQEDTDSGVAEVGKEKTIEPAEDKYSGYTYNETESIVTLTIQEEEDKNVFKVYYDAVPGLAVTKTITDVTRDGEPLNPDNPEVEVKEGDVIEYEITVRNSGKLNLTDIVLTDEFTGAEGDLNIISGDDYTVDGYEITLKNDLNVGDSVTIKATYEVQLGDSGYEITNKASGTAKDALGGNVTGESRLVRITPDALKAFRIFGSVYKYVKSEKGTFNKDGETVPFEFKVTSDKKGEEILDTFTIDVDETVKAGETSEGDWGGFDFNLSEEEFENLDKKEFNGKEYPVVYLWELKGDLKNMSYSTKRITLYLDRPNISYYSAREPMVEYLGTRMAYADPDKGADADIINIYGKQSSSGGTVKTGPQLNRDDHVAYIMGYPDGTVQPEGQITRAEACTIFFRLLTDSSRDYYFARTNDYSDVNRGDWFNNAISTLSNAGIVTGYNDGTFRPNQPITRGEMAKIIANFANLNKGTKSFTDLSGHWSKTYVELAAGNGWIAGYPDGSFRPDQKITRAETVTMINRVLERVPAKELRLLSRSIMLTFPDNNPGDWYYIAIQEASNSHEYQRSVYETTGDEMWTKLIDNVDWTKLEK